MIQAGHARIKPVGLINGFLFFFFICSVAFALGSLALLVLALGLLAGWLVFFWSFLRFGMFNVLVLAKVRSA